MKHKKSGRWYFTENPPEDFWDDISTVRKPGYVYLNDSRQPSFIKDKWSPHYVKPSALAQKLSKEYPLGYRIGSIKVIQWDNNQLLTIINNEAITGDFSFDFWAGLTPLKSNQIQKNRN